MKPLVSVIVPLYNKEKWVSRCVNSIINQTCQEIEIIVINDGSTDASKQVVSEMSDPRIRNYDKTNGGPSSARNCGIEKSVGKYVAFIDADDEWNPAHLEHLLRGFELHNDAILVADDLVEVFEGGEDDLRFRLTPFERPDRTGNSAVYYRIEGYLETLGAGYFLLSGSSVLVKLEVLLENNLKFITESEPAEDMNYWIRLERFGVFVFCDFPGVLYHRVDPKSMMNRHSATANLTAPYFYDVDINSYEKHEQKNVKKFVTREYYKKAFQNRDFPLNRTEFSTIVGGGIRINRFSLLPYLLIRLLPAFLLLSLKKLIRR